MSDAITQIPYLTIVDFGDGAVDVLAPTLQEQAITRPLLLTDRGVAAVGLVDRAVSAMRSIAPAAIFDETPANPTERAVAAAMVAYQQAKCDGLVALGGGSAIDLAKVVAMMVTHRGPLRRFAAAEGGAKAITAAVAPLVAVPTTAGTGSEVGRAALIVMDDARKLAFISPHLLPRRALCDPRLTHSMPPGMTAATGMDAIAHCVETFLSPRVNPPADAIALDGLTRARTHIARACAAGDDSRARWQMMMAALQGGLCFPKGLGAVHALSHALGALRDPVLHHGTLNAALLPAVLRFNASGQPEKYARLRQAMGLEAGADIAAAFAALNAQLGLPRGIGDMGVPDRLIPALAQAALADLSTATNPRPASAADYEAILHAAW